MDCEDMQMIISEEPNLSERKEGGKRGRKPGRKASNEKVDIKAKLERSRQSARECRARKKLRYQYLEELVADREKAVLALRAELERLDNIKSDEPSTSAEMEPTTSKVITRASDKVSREIYLIGNVTHQISGAKLPSNRQVLQVYFYNIRFAKLSQKESARLAVNAVSLFWLQARLPIRDLYKCADKLIKLYNEWRRVSKKSSKGKANKDQTKFIQNLDNLFDIAHNNALQMIRIEEDREFLLKQRQKGHPGCMIGVDMHLFSREKRSQERRSREESRNRKHDESQNYIQWNSELNEGSIPNGFQQLLEEAGILKQEVIV